MDETQQMPAYDMMNDDEPKKKGGKKEHDPGNDILADGQTRRDHEMTLRQLEANRQNTLNQNAIKRHMPGMFVLQELYRNGFCAESCAYALGFILTTAMVNIFAYSDEARPPRPKSRNLFTAATRSKAGTEHHDMARKYGEPTERDRERAQASIDDLIRRDGMPTAELAAATGSTAPVASPGTLAYAGRVAEACADPSQVFTEDDLREILYEASDRLHTDNPMGQAEFERRIDERIAEKDVKPTEDEVEDMLRDLRRQSMLPVEMVRAGRHMKGVYDERLYEVFAKHTSVNSDKADGERTMCIMLDGNKEPKRMLENGDLADLPDGPFKLRKIESMDDQTNKLKLFIDKINEECATGENAIHTAYIDHCNDLLEKCENPKHVPATETDASYASIRHLLYKDSISQSEAKVLDGLIMLANERVDGDVPELGFVREHLDRMRAHQAETAKVDDGRTDASQTEHSNAPVMTPASTGDAAYNENDTTEEPQP